jgi:hypothetical protein
VIEHDPNIPHRNQGGSAMPNHQNKSKERAEELNQLIVMQGIMVRTMKYAALGEQGFMEPEAETEARARRLIELVEMLGAHVNAPGYEGEEITPERYVNDRIAAWMRMNPLPLSHTHLTTGIENMREEHPEVSSNANVYVVIGEGEKRYEYRVMVDDFEINHVQQVKLQVPEGVAEHFRQQGRRQLQRALQRELGL